MDQRSTVAVGGPTPAQGLPPRVRRALPAWLKWVGGLVAVLALAVILFLAFADWNMLRGPIGRYASARIGRTVVLHGNLDVRPFHWSPRATVEALTISKPAWQGPGDMIAIDRMAVSVRLLPLLAGRLEVDSLDLKHPDLDLLNDARGRANWTFSSSNAANAGRFPAIHRLIISDGRIRYLDQKRRLSIVGSVRAVENAGARSSDQGFRMDGQGSLNGNSFTVLIHGGALLNVRPDKAYPFVADLRAGATHVSLKGIVPKPFDLRRLDVDLTAEGRDLKDLYEVSGIVFPNSPPYRLTTHLERKDSLYVFKALNGRVGSSDLEGGLAVRTGLLSGRPLLAADLRSRRLDFADLSSLFGGRSKAYVAEKASSQVTVLGGADKAADRRLLPDATLDVQRLRSMDARVHYRAESILASKLPLKQASLDMRLDDGVLVADPVAFTFPQGRFQAYVKLDAQGAVPRVDTDARLTHVDLAPFLAKTAQPTAITGRLEARARLHGEGASVHKAASNATGSVTLVIPRGEVRQAFAELAGVNLANGLGLLLSGSRDKSDIRCAVADFSADNGVLTARRLVIDTDVVILQGGGSINLRDESLDLNLKGAPKEFRLGHLYAPVQLGGHLSSPKLGVSPSGVIAQIGIAGALGVLATPLAAILPFVDPGLAKDANCTGLMSAAVQHGGTPQATVAQTARANPSKAPVKR